MAVASRIRLRHYFSPLNSQNPILEAWTATREACRGAPAILDANGKTLRSFAEIEENAQAFSEAFEHMAPSSVVAVQVGNSVLLPSLLLAIWRHHCIPVLLDRSLEGPARESALSICAAAGLLTMPNAVGVTDDAHFSLEHRPGAPLADGTEFLKLTSGTTSAPRAIRFTAAQLLADCNTVCDTMGIGEGDVNYGVIPWSHSYGFSNLVTPLLCRGIPVVATEDRLPRAILNGLGASGATVFPAVPVFYQKLCDLPRAPLNRLRLCISAGAPLAAATAGAFRDQYGLKIHGFYGSSECGGIAYDASADEVVEGCVGKVMQGVRIEHDEASGRIEVHSSAVGLGYFPDPEPEILGGGRFVPGDLLRQTKDGFVIAGRVSDFINIAGRKLNPAEVEHVLRACPGVREAIVFGVPHPSRGEEPVACVVGGTSIAELQAHCARSLMSWQIPRVFWCMESLPVNERGKLSRRMLAELYLKEHAE